MALGGACDATVGLGVDGATVGWWQMGWGDAMGREAEKASEFPVAAVAAQDMTSRMTRVPPMAEDIVPRWKSRLW